MAVEWAFGKILTYFPFVDFKKNQKVLLQPVGQMYRVAAFLTNLHTCFYRSGTISSHFQLQPPSPKEYLASIQTRVA